jgi:hypothetical protein
MSFASWLTPTLFLGEAFKSGSNQSFSDALAKILMAGKLYRTCLHMVQEPELKHLIYFLFYKADGLPGRFLFVGQYVFQNSFGQIGALGIFR